MHTYFSIYLWFPAIAITQTCISPWLMWQYNNLISKDRRKDERKRKKIKKREREKKNRMRFQGNILASCSRILKSSLKNIGTERLQLLMKYKLYKEQYRSSFQFPLNSTDFIASLLNRHLPFLYSYTWVKISIHMFLWDRIPLPSSFFQKTLMCSKQII